jgi:hypothetical protein
MSEDVSATMRVGITVILVAALVATVLNLMVMSNSLLSGGQTTLQSGIDSVSTQEFATYDNTKVSGTQVATALSLFQGRDVAVVVQTKALQALGTDWKNKAINYGALLTKDNKAATKTNLADLMADTGGTITKNENIITAQARTAYIITWTDANSGAGIVRKDGAANYEGYLHNTNGLVDSSYDIIGTTELGNAAYLLSSARFSSVLIKDPTGSIIGIFFRQLS